MKTTKRFVALLMAVVMVFALSAVALAKGGVFSPVDPAVGFTIPKGIIMVNNTNGTYTRPEVTFDFQIFSDNNISDEELKLGAHVSGVNVYRGRAGGLLGLASTNGDTSVQTVLNSPDTNEYKISLNFKSLSVSDVNNNYGKISKEPLKFTTSMDPYAGLTQPGIYRYKVTDITDSEYLRNIGISRDNKYDHNCYVDLYIQVTYDGDTPQPAVASVVVSQLEDKVPLRNSNGNIEATNTTDNSTQEFDPGKVYVTEDGTVWTLTDENKVDPKFPVDYTETTYKVDGDNMKKGLVKSENVFNDLPDYDFTDNNSDELPDVDPGTKIPSTADLPNTVPAIDDEGNYTDTDGKKYPSDEYKVDETTGEIKKSDGSALDDGPKYAQRIGKFDYEQSDVYETFNVVVTKDTSGPMGDTTHQFPFAVSIKNKTLATAAPDPQSLPFIYFNKDVDGSVIEDSDGNGEGEVTLATKLAHNQKFIIRGLNANATINIEETNDTSFLYQVTMKGSDKVPFIEAFEAKTNGGKAKMSDSPKNVATIDEHNRFTATNVDRIDVFNYQNNVNPTGVVLRFAPYILMLGAAFFFVALSRRRREQENA